MKPMQIISLAVAGAVLGALAGAGWLQWQKHRGTPELAAGQALQETVPNFSYVDIDGRQRGANEWYGKVVVLNFWATWCPPCREETPLFVELQETLGPAGLQFVGIAIDDREPVREFVASYGINYPTLLGDMNAVELSRRLGNRFGGLPFTIVAAQDGEILLRHAGELKRERLEPLLRDLLASDKKA